MPVDCERARFFVSLDKRCKITILNEDVDSPTIEFTLARLERGKALARVKPTVEPSIGPEGSDEIRMFSWLIRSLFIF